MAYTKIIPIRTRLDVCLRYVCNDKKTDLENALDYIANKDRTGTLQSAFHCKIDTAFTDMRTVKRRWKKDSGNHVQGYHVIFSFKPGEVTPEKAHELGCELVARFLKDEYQSVVTTHVDKAHLHCHIVFNSVSLLTGKMFRDSFADYFDGIRKTADEICRENGLSTIKPKGKSRSRSEYEAGRRGDPTLRSLIRKDVDETIDRARDWNDFLQLLAKQGYAIKAAPRYKHTAIRRPGAERFVRLHSLGAQYTEEAIKQRILDRYTYGGKRPMPPEKKVFHCRYRGKLSKRRKYKGFIALYFRYVYLLRGSRADRQPRRVSRLVMDDVIRLDKIVVQHKAIAKYKIETSEDMIDRCTEIKSQIQQLVDKRKELKHEPEKQEAALSEIADRLRELRRDLRTLAAVEQTAPRIQEQLRQIDEQEARVRKEREEYDRSKRSRRPAHPRGYTIH
ncbi:hypothetical protein D7X33_11365 [Butyricicoccus sp. 1XD8-22]|nr:hypothetical protein D7X33_11365 [Butyricicoccus sp. 1XD8-22]